MLLAVDLGGTAAKLSLVDEENALHFRREVSVCFDGYRTPIQDTTLQAVKSLLCETSEAVEGICVSATGQIDIHTGTVIGTNGAITGYEGVCLQGMMEEAFHLPTSVVNDASAALLGEMAEGAAKGCSDVLMVTLGTGVGGAFAINGKLVTGSLGLAGEIGHMILHADGKTCTCGCRGCFERYASASAWVRSVKQATGEEQINGRILFERAKQGDAAVLSSLEAWREDISCGVISLIHLLNPGMVLFGGGVCTQEELLIQPIRERVLSGVMPCFARGLRIEQASLGNDAGMIGAACWWRETYQTPSKTLIRV